MNKNCVEVARSILFSLLLVPSLGYAVESWCPTKINPKSNQLESLLAIHFGNFFAELNVRVFERHIGSPEFTQTEDKIARELECKYVGPDVWLAPIKAALAKRYSRHERRELTKMISEEGYSYNRNTDKVFLEWAVGVIDIVFDQYHYQYADYEALKAKIYYREFPNLPEYRRNQFVLTKCQEVFNVSMKLTNPVSVVEFAVCGNGVRSNVSFSDADMDYRFVKLRDVLLFDASIKNKRTKSVYVDVFSVNQGKDARCIGKCNRTLSVSIIPIEPSTAHYSIGATNIAVGELAPLLESFSSSKFLNISALASKTKASYYFDAIPFAPLVQMLADAGGGKINDRKPHWTFERK